MPGSCLQIRRAQGPGEGIPIPNSPGEEAMSLLFVIHSQLNEGKIVESFAARGRYDVVWNFDR